MLWIRMFIETKFDNRIMFNLTDEKNRRVEDKLYNYSVSPSRGVDPVGSGRFSIRIQFVLTVVSDFFSRRLDTDPGFFSKAGSGSTPPGSPALSAGLPWWSIWYHTLTRYWHYNLSYRTSLYHFESLDYVL